MINFDAAFGQEFLDISICQPGQAVKSMLGVIVGCETKTLAESMADEMAAATAGRGSADSQEGMRAFVEKRKPVFNQSL